MLMSRSGWTVRRSTAPFEDYRFLSADVYRYSLRSARAGTVRLSAKTSRRIWRHFYNTLRLFDYEGVVREIDLSELCCQVEK